MFGLVVLWPQGFGKALHPWKEFWRIDFIGNIFILAACVLMVYSLQQAGTMIFSWTSVEFLATFTISVVCWALFWAWQLILRQLPIQVEPVFPVRLVYHRIYMAAVLYVLKIFVAPDSFFPSFSIFLLKCRCVFRTSGLIPCNFSEKLTPHLP